MPLRDDRRGKRATVGGNGSPLRATFAAVAPVDARAGAEASEPVSGISGDGQAALSGVAGPSGGENRVLARFAAYFSARQNAAAAPKCTVPPQPPSGTAGKERPGGLPAEGERTAEGLHFRDLTETFANLSRRIGRGILRERTGNARPLCEPIKLAVTAPEQDFVSERSFADELASLIDDSREVEPFSGGANFRQPELVQTGNEPVWDPNSRAPSNEDTAPLILQATPGVFERVLPLTRLPLRAQVDAISWPGLVRTTPEPWTRAERHALLATLGSSPDVTAQAALLQAYREEDGQGRLLALRALMRGKFERSTAVFREALHLGTDDERALAVDALVSVGDRTGIVAAFSDRVDAIAAKAALAYVGTATAEAYRAALSPHMDESRIEIVLDLLAGIVE